MRSVGKFKEGHYILPGGCYITDRVTAEMIRAEISVRSPAWPGNGSRPVPLPITDDATVKPITKQEQEATATRKGTDRAETASVDTGGCLRISRF